jgi:glycosyltransferase involved in cell wall biosynthesis
MEGNAGRRREILYVCDFNSHGGTQTHLLHLFETLDRSRFGATLAALTLHPELARRLEKLDVAVVDLRLRKAAHPSTARAALALASRARREADLIHGCLFQGNILSSLVSRLSGVPCITSVRNVDGWKKPRHRRLSAWAHRRAARVVFNSGAVRDLTVRRERIRPDRAIVIPNGVADPPRGLAMPDDLADPGRPTVVCVASLREKKGHAHLIEAFEGVRARIGRARLLLVGDGPLRERLEGMARSKGLAPSILFTGFREDIPSILAGSDLFVLSSIEEGMPNALLESMAARLPSVATRVGGIGEIVIDGEPGHLVPPAEPGPLAERIGDLLLDAGRRRRLGEAARRRFEALFTLGRMASAYQALYEELLR